MNYSILHSGIYLPCVHYWRMEKYCSNFEKGTEFPEKHQFETEIKNPNIFYASLDHNCTC